MSSTELSPRPPNRVGDSRAGKALRARHNWEQLLKFSLVGASGFVINLAVFTLLWKHLHYHYLAAATGSFLVAATSNYALNRMWTFRSRRGHVGIQGARFLVVATAAWLTNLAFLRAFVALTLPTRLSQAIAIILVTPVNFLGNKLWSFRR
jgi:dolichol-phosphate mannosyltransferase